MKLSVIIPAYNVEKYIAECLDSVLLTKKDIEVIIIDDGSRDRTLQISQDYSRKDSRVIVYSKPNGGVSSARNYAVKKASGDYLAFVDSDDVLSEEWDTILDHLSGEDIIYFDADIKGRPDKNMMLRYISGINDEGICCAGPVCKAFRRIFIQDHDLKFHEDLINGEDMLFNLEALLRSNSYKVVAFQYYYYRQTVGQTTRRFDDRLIDTDTKFHSYLAVLLDELKADEKTAADIKSASLNNAVFLILNRISYVGRFSQAKEKYAFLEKEPYKSAVRSSSSFLYKLCGARRYRTLYYYLRFKNLLTMSRNGMAKEQFIKL